MGENQILFTLGALQMTQYSLCIAAGVILATLLTIMMAGEHRAKAIDLCLWTIPCALIGSHLAYCLAKIALLTVDYQHGYALLVMPWMGGYNMYGSVLGALAGIWLSDRKHFARTADLAAPGAMLMVAVARAAEYFTGEGLGEYLEGEAVCRFPLGVCTYADEYWAEWRVPVFFWESVVAILLMVLAIALLRKGGKARRDGHVAAVTLTLMSTSQILLESLRQDELIKFGFVRFNQLAAAVMLLAVMVIRMMEYRSTKRWQIVRCILFVLGVGGVVAVEFGLDKSPINNLLLYAFMVLMLAMMAVAVLLERKEKQ